MEHNLRRLPHCSKHHRSCCAGPAFLRNLPGRLCTLFGTRYILATVDSAPTLIPLCSQTEKLKGLDWALEDLVWREGQLLSVEDLPDGVELKFDALMPVRQGDYQIVFAWEGSKPDKLDVPTKGTCLLLKYHKNVEIDCTLAGNLFVIVNIGQNVYQLETPKVCIVNGNFIDKCVIEANELAQMKACVSVVLSRTLTGFLKKHIVTALYSGDLPPNLENPSEMEFYEEPPVGIFHLAKEKESIMFDSRLTGENLNYLLRALFQNDEQHYLCRDWNTLDECTVHSLINLKSQQMNVCFFSDLTYCSARTNEDDDAKGTDCWENIVESVQSKDIVTEGAETQKIKSDSTHSAVSNAVYQQDNSHEVSSLRELDREDTQNSENFRSEDKSEGDSQIISNDPVTFIRPRSETPKKKLKPKNKKKPRSRNKMKWR